MLGHARDVGGVERVEHADQHGAGLHQRQFGGVGGGDLEHQGGAQRGGGIAEMGAGSDVGVIRDAGSQAGTGLHDDLVALGDQFLHRFRRGGHAGFPGVGFERDADVHVKAPVWTVISQEVLRAPPVAGCIRRLPQPLWWMVSKTLSKTNRYVLIGS
ncbi:hypothetical protein D3C78_889790 [compost metagenome]